MQSFNGRPYEIVLNTNHCHDSATDVNPTCGWFLDATGTKVYDSQVIDIRPPSAMITVMEVVL